MSIQQDAVCQWCGKKAEYTECTGRHPPPEDARCIVLKDWLSVSQWKGMEAVDYYDFCSLTCLHSWAGSKVPKVPETFDRAFEE